MKESYQKIITISVVVLTLSLIVFGVLALTRLGRIAHEDGTSTTTSPERSLAVVERDLSEENSSYLFYISMVKEQGGKVDVERVREYREKITGLERELAILTKASSSAQTALSPMYKNATTLRAKIDNCRTQDDLDRLSATFSTLFPKATDDLVDLLTIVKESSDLELCITAAIALSTAVRRDWDEVSGQRRHKYAGYAVEADAILNDKVSDVMVLTPMQIWDTILFESSATIEWIKKRLEQDQSTQQAGEELQTVACSAEQKEELLRREWFRKQQREDAQQQD